MRVPHSSRLIFLRFLNIPSPSRSLSRFLLVARRVRCQWGLRKWELPASDNFCQGSSPWVETSVQDLSVGASLWRQNCLGRWETQSNIEVLEGTLHFVLVKCSLKVMSCSFSFFFSFPSLVTPLIPGIFVQPCASSSWPFNLDTLMFIPCMKTFCERAKRCQYQGLRIPSVWLWQEMLECHREGHGWDKRSTSNAGTSLGISLQLLFHPYFQPTVTYPAWTAWCGC